MPPRFRTESFDFKTGEDVPEHIEEFPFLEEADPSKYTVKGTDTFDHSDYAVAVDVDDFETAQFLAQARRRLIERTQPDAGEIQDRTTVVEPEY